MRRKVKNKARDAGIKYNPEAPADIAVEVRHPVMAMVLADENMRSKAGRKAIPKQPDLELRASLMTNGLIHNLVGYRTDQENEAGVNIIAVLAGGRRMMGFQGAIGDDQLPEDYAARIIVTTPEHALALSLAENADRVGAHEADEVRAYKKLADAGRSLQQIAEERGVGIEAIKKVVRLGSLHPKILAAYGRDEIRRGAALAYASTADTKRQLHVWTSLESWGRADVTTIRHHINDETMVATHPLVRFITRAVYEKAGGKFEEDLFSGYQQADTELRLTDTALVRRLAQEKLDKIAAREGKGYAWNEASVSANMALERERAPLDKDETPDEVRAAYVALQARTVAAEEAYERAEEALSTEGGDLEQEAHDEAEEAITKLWDAHSALESECRTERTRMLAEYHVHGDEVRALSGVLVTLDGDGKARVTRGCVRAEQLADYRKLTRAAGGGAAGAAGAAGSDRADSDRDNDGMSGASKGPSRFERDIGVMRRQALGAGMAAPEKAEHVRTLLEFQLVSQSLGLYCCAVGRVKVFGLSVEGVSNDTAVERADDTLAGKQLAERRAMLDLSWTECKTFDAAYEAFTALAPESRDALIAYAGASLLIGGDPHGHGSPVPDAALAALAIDAADHWRPSATNYFGRLHTKDLVALAPTLSVSAWATSFAKATKKVIVAKFSEVFTGDGEGLTEADARLSERWVPEQMRTDRGPVVEDETGEGSTGTVNGGDEPEVGTEG